jgi:predicted ATP-dependent serine protease
MGIVIAPTGVGKSTCLTHIASEMAQDKNKVLHIIFEGDLNRQLELHNRKLGTERLSSNLVHLKDYLKIAKLPEGETTISDVIGAIEKTKKSIDGIDVVVIDYLDCIKSNNKFRDFWQGESDVVNELEKYAVDNNIVVWTAVQTNRTGLNGEDGNNSQVAGSKKKLDKASMVVFLTRNETQKENNTATMKITKNRHGVLAEVKNFKYNPSEIIIDTDNQQLL